MALDKFWKFKNAVNNTVELLLYGEIKSEKSWWDDWCGGSGVYADEFVQDLRDLGNVSQITCRINSIGGDIFAAIAIYTQLKTHAAKIIGIVDGLAASAATLVLMACDEIQMPIGAMQMIHDPLTCLCGIYNADELAKNVDTLNTIKESIVAIYANRTGQKETDIAAMMNAEKWMTTAEAVKLGFCDTTLAARVENMEMKGRVLYMDSVKHDLSGFKTLPELEHAANIMDAITAHNADSNIVTEFVALAKKKDAAPDETDNPDDDPETPEDDDKKGKKNSKKKDEDETIDDDDAEDEDCHDEDKGKKAKNAMQRLINKYPKLTALVATNARSEERQRIKDIDAIAGQVDPALLAKAKYETFAMAKDLAFEHLQASKVKGAAQASAFLSGFQTDTAASGVKTVGAAPNTFTDQNEQEHRESIGDFIAKAANKVLHRGRA